MGSDIVDLEERLSSLLLQIQAESGILDRIVYKGKNQHRRCSYFQYLMKVRRDVKLLVSARLKEILSFLFQVIDSKTPNKKVYLLESLKRRKCNSEKHNFQERLLGVARLLSQMVEPMVKAATEISTLLARSFFMGFSLTILALLARLRVLVQQILLDVVSVFNMVSSISQKEHSVKLSRGGIEVFREYYPSKEEFITLECVWEKDKFILLEKSKPVDRDCGVEELPLRPSKIEYRSIEAFLGVDEFDSKKMEVDDSIEERPNTIKGYKSDDASADKPIEISKSTENEEGRADVDIEHSSPDKNSGTGGSNITRPSPLASSKSQQLQIESKKRVAFISIRKPTLTPTPTDNSKLFNNLTATDSLATRTSEKDPFFDLLTGGNLKDSLF